MVVPERRAPNTTQTSGLDDIFVIFPQNVICKPLFPEQVPVSNAKSKSFVRSLSAPPVTADPRPVFSPVSGRVRANCAPLPNIGPPHSGFFRLCHDDGLVTPRSDKHITWITTTFGTSRRVKAAGQWFAAKARAAGIHGRAADGLGKSRSQALAEAGGNSVQIGAWTGHDSLFKIERYIRGLNKIKGAQQHESRTKSSNFSEQSSSSTKKTGESDA